MFDILFGWRKASKCKNLVSRVQCRLKILKRRRCSIVRHLREDIAQLLKNGQNESAFARVEQLFMDESLFAAYDMLDHFCEFIIIHFPYIRRHKDCPDDVNEAVSTLIFAAAWFGDLPELQTIRKLFGERYGNKFTKASVELYPACLVNQEIREKLCIRSISHDVKLRLINEIAIDYRHHVGHLGYDDNNHRLHIMPLSMKCDCEWEGFVFEGEAQVKGSSASGVQMLASYDQESPLDTSSMVEPAKLILEPLYKKPVLRSAFLAENYAHLDHLYEPKLLQSNLSCQSSIGSFCSNELSAASSDNRIKRGKTATSSEISFKFHRRTIVYLDEIEEFQFDVQDHIGEDKRIFVFNPTILPLKDNYGVDRPSSFVSPQLEVCESVTTIPETQDKRAWLGDSFKRMKSSGKWWERRFDSRKSPSHQSYSSPALSRNDAAFELSYGSMRKFSPSKKCLSHRFFHQRKLWRKMPNQEARWSSSICNEKNLSHHQLEVHRKCIHNHRSSNCKFSHEKDFNFCLQHPCYFRIIKDKFHWESPSWRQKMGMAALAGFSKHNFSQEKCIRVWDSPPQNSRGKNSKMASQVNSFNKKSNKLGGAEVSECLAGGASSQDSYSMASSSPYPEPERFAHTTYSTTMTVSPEKPKSTTPSHSHVHPKLPDYEELEAKFRALKQDHLCKELLQLRVA